MLNCSLTKQVINRATGAMWRGMALLLTLLMKTAVTVHIYDSEYELASHHMKDFPEQIGSYVATVSDEEYIRHVHSKFDAYGAGGEGVVIETNALINTKFRAWKRNADLINSLLALPKGMNEAGR